MLNGVKTGEKFCLLIINIVLFIPFFNNLDGAVLSIQINEKYCIGCRLCEVHCTVEHSASKDIFRAFKSERPAVLSRIHVDEKKPVSVPLQCRHCKTPLCVSACLTGALSKDENGVVLHNPDKCIGCWTCIMVCPFGAISRDECGKKVASKCDLCPSRKIPACVENCPNEALIYVEAK